jgi:F420-0:gamma-glutamyl ligase
MVNLIRRRSKMKKVEILGLGTVPDIKSGDKLADVIVRCAEDEVDGIREKDIIIITSKIVSNSS